MMLSVEKDKTEMYILARDLVRAADHRFQNRKQLLLSLGK
jgi:hypothetical protein